MASTLKSRAAGAANKGQPSTYYGKADRGNPVFQGLEQEMKLYVAYMKKRSSPGYAKPNDEPSSRASDALFDLWNKYEPKLPTMYYQEKLLEMGDFLVSMKEYNLALWQCYGRYLKHFGDINVEEITDVDTFKNVFFPDGFDTDDAGFTFRALMGKSICMAQVVTSTDPKLQNSESVYKCIQILTFLRLVTQVVLPKEPLCWLVYNGTIHIYSVSRHLMSLGHCAKVLEYLLWACMCMESSVPLLSVRYLPWRVTLYTAVCQCYYDCKASHHAEAFARRAISKINELSQLENMSSSKESLSTEATFRQATAKMAIMVFKRSSFESRKRPKGLLRPKTRANLKDAQVLPWPRTPTEKLLADMFEGSAAQFLCIVETLSDSNRRTLLTAPPAPETEVEVLDVFAELFMAAQEIISGGGGNAFQNPNPKPSMVNVQGMAGVVTNKTLIEMVTQAEDGVPLSAVVKLVKLAYCYEQWDIFDSLVEMTLSYMKEINDGKYDADAKAIEILLAMEKASSSHRVRRQASMHFSEDESVQEGALPLPPEKAASSVKSGLVHDELIQLSDVLMSVCNGSLSQDQMDMDIMVDATLFLWNKCKVVFQRYQTGSTENAKYLQRMENPSKWVYILENVHHCIGWCRLSTVDPTLAAEVIIRLALVLEASAALDVQDSKSQSASKRATTATTDYDTSRRPSLPSRTSFVNMSVLNQGEREKLIAARDILELGLQNMSSAREATALTDGKSIADIGWVKELNKEQFAPMTWKEIEEGHKVEEFDPTKTRDATAVLNAIRDMHLELIFMYHRVGLKLTALGPDPTLKVPKGFKRKTCSRQQFYGSRDSLPKQPAYVENFDELLQMCNKNQLSKALLLMQRALSQNTGRTQPTEEQRKMLEDAVQMIIKAQADEKKLYMENALSDRSLSKNSKVPPPPILLCRTDTTMVFQPAPFNPAGERVAWYRLFGRSASGSNVKVRLNDYFISGCGEVIPAFRCELRVSGLNPNERYVFALAAYTADGKLIGDSIGETSKPILASHPLPVLMTWAFLSQVAYQCNCFSIAHQACQVLWGHFVAEPPPPENVTYITTGKEDFQLTLHRLNSKVVSLASPILLRQFLASIFINVDISVKQLYLFCDRLCDKGPLYESQINRLKECERMLIALELAGWLNEANLALQAVVQCYGLLAPLIFNKIPSVPVIQVLQRCQAVLLEIPVGLRQRRQEKISESLHHMCACISYHMAKVLRTWNQRHLANSVNENGRKLLALEDAGKVDPSARPEVAALENNEEDPMMTLAALKKKKAKKGTYGVPDPDGPVNEELKALEAHMLKLSKQAQGEHELTGNEDPSILHAYIAYLPSRIAYKEVSKFKRRTRYLEFFVQVCQKALTEGIAEIAIEWCEDAMQWIIKRNEGIIGSKGIVQKQAGAVAIAGDDPKKFAAAMVEYGAEGPKEPHTPRKTAGAASQGKGSTTKGGVKPKKKYKLLKSSTVNLTEAQRQAQEEAEQQAIEKLALYFPDMMRTATRRRRFRKVSVEEMPWRSQLDILQGLSHFGVFLHKVETREKVLGNYTNNLYSTSFMDQEWFTFETAGTLVVGWDGGPKRVETRQDRHDSPAGRLPTHESWYSTQPSDPDGARTTGIEIAAAAATGQAPPPLFPIPIEEEDTPRTYRSEVDMETDYIKTDPDSALISNKEALQSLSITFEFFKKAVVLAHRGQHWTLLQNACRALWNCAHTALIRTLSTHQHSVTGGGLVNIEQLRSLLWRPFFTASDCLLDMWVKLQDEKDKENSKAKSKGIKVDGTDFMGSSKDEKGGASLKFEAPLDDHSTVDARWMRRIVLRTLEVLYYEHKWERLVDIGLRFNALSNDRYSEQVIPLLVQAQRKLLQRIENNNAPEYPQAHFRAYMEEIGRIITAKDYLHMQLKVETKAEDLPTIHVGAHIDPEGHQVYSGKKDGLRLVSVPLEVPFSLSTLRQALDTSGYTSKALQHSRKLMVLYMSGQQSASGESLPPGYESRVDFVPNTAKPMSVMPPDTKKEEYLTADDVQTTPLPRSQIGVVIASYDKTIEMLLAKNQKSLAAQAMHELGNLHYHNGNIRGAYKWWAESLDVIMNTTDALHKWRSLFDSSQDISSELVSRCGLWGCVMGGIITSNVAQYILTSDLGLRMECCFLSGYFFKALFRSSLPHPMADRDYALYEVGEGCEVTNLVPGIDLLSDRYRCDGRTLVAGLRWVTEELARGRHNLFVLPLLTLYQHFTTFVCRDLQRAVDGYILKVRILTDLGLFTEALICLQRLLHGERLPHTADSNFRQVESKMSSVKFNTEKPVLEPSNLKVLENVVDKRLSSSLASLYGPHMTCHLSLVQAHLFIAISETIPVLPVFEDLGLEGKQRTFTSLSKSAVKTRTPAGPRPPSMDKDVPRKPIPGSSLQVEEGSDSESDITKVVPTKRFTDARRTVTLEIVKGTLLGIAESMLSTLSEIIIETAESDKGIECVAAAELELVVLCKLELGNISRQRHHGSLAARTVLSAMKILQGADLFKEKQPDEPPKRESILKSSKSRVPSSMRGSRRTPWQNVRLTDIENSQFKFQNFQSRSRLDARLWLECRLALVKSLMTEVRGMGEVKGPNTDILKELGECRQYCIEGVTEAEACGDIEMQAEFLMQGVMLNIMEGKGVEETKLIIKEILKLLDSVQRLSSTGQLLQTLAIIELTDLDVSTVIGEKKSDSITTKTLKTYMNAQMSLLKQLQNLGESLEYHYPHSHDQLLHFTTLVSPIKNIYLKHVLHLGQVKFRIGHAMARNAARYAKEGGEDAHTQFASALGVLETALEISRVAVTREANLEAEILLNIGKVQRQLYNLGKYHPKAVVATLIEAIKTSYDTDHDLGVIRQAYLEIAMVYVSKVSSFGLQKEETVESETSAGESGDDIASVATAATAKTTPKGKRGKGWKGRKDRSKVKSAKEAESEEDRERRAAWTAIRCAATVGAAQRARLLLPGDTSVTSQPLSSTAQGDIPEFAVLDLVSSYVFGERKKVYKNEIEEEMAPLIESLQEDKQADTYDDEIKKAVQEAKDVSWIHLLGYQAILQRISSTSTVTAPAQKKEPETTQQDQDVDLGFLSHAQFDISLNHDVVRSTIFSGVLALRLNHLHEFFTTHLPIYASECCAIYPPKEIILAPPTDVPATELQIVCKKYAANRTVPLDAQPDASTPVTTLPPASRQGSYRPSDKNVLTSAENDLSLQWYQPALESFVSYPRPQTSVPSTPDSSIVLLYSVGKKADKADKAPVPAASLQFGLQWVSLKQLIDLHDRLAVLAQRGEISIQEKPKKEPAPPTSSAGKGSKKTARIKALSPKIKKDEQLEALLRQCLNDTQVLFGVVPEQEPSLDMEIPFDVSKSNMYSFEKLFDPSFGFTLKQANMLNWFIKLFS